MNNIGIDVSEAQGTINFDLITAEYVIIRVGFGSDIDSQDDKQFARNVAECTRKGIPYGLYLYSYALNMDECLSEVKHFLRLYNSISDKSMLKLGCWYDMEDADYYKKKNMGADWSNFGDLWSSFCNRWVDEVKKATGETMVGVYASLSPLRGCLSGVRSDIPKWVACWIDGNPDTSSPIFPNAYFWQYTSGGKMDGIYSRGLDMDISYIDVPSVRPTPTPTPQPTPSVNPTIDVEYAVKTAESGWLPFVKNLNDYAGLYGQKIIDFAVRVSQGSVEYQAHDMSSGWLGKITKCDLNDFNYGYAGNNAPIDCLKVYFYTPSDYVAKYDYKRAKYRVHVLGGDWYDWQYDTETGNGQDGYAGAYGVAIDGLQIVIE